MLGFVNGPLDAFSVPVGAVLTDRVDQPNAVTLVLGAPSGDQLIAYYRRALPEAGFRITADRPQADTLVFTGQGWSGVLTGTGSVTAIALRPA